MFTPIFLILYFPFLLKFFKGCFLNKFRPLPLIIKYTITEQGLGKGHKAITNLKVLVFDLPLTDRWISHLQHFFHLLYFLIWIGEASIDQQTLINHDNCMEDGTALFLLENVAKGFEIGVGW